MTDQLFTGSYPSDALTEAKQLRARVAELEAALTRIKNYTGHPTATTQAERNVFAWASDALTATHSAKSPR